MGQLVKLEEARATKMLKDFKKAYPSLQYWWALVTQRLKKGDEHDQV